MANTVQARKRARQNDRRRMHNNSFRSRTRTYIKKVIAAIRENKKEEACAAYREMSSILDKAAGKKLLHANKAARYKSRLNARLKSLA